MKVIWKIVGIAVLALVVLGAVCGAVGYFTGGSVERMVEIFFGSREGLDLVIKLLKDELAAMF